MQCCFCSDTHPTSSCMMYFRLQFSTYKTVFDENCVTLVIKDGDKFSKQHYYRNNGDPLTIHRVFSDILGDDFLNEYIFGSIKDDYCATLFTEENVHKEYVEKMEIGTQIYCIKK